MVWTMDGAPEFPPPIVFPATLLAGVRVVSIATNVPGPVAVARLVALGASGCKVEPPGGDYLAFAARGWYDALRAGCDVQVLDLKTPEGQGALGDELAGADVFLTSHRPRALERLGLASDALLERFPRLCVVRIVGHAEADGDLPGHDLTYQATAGLVTPPTLPPTLFADVAAGEAAATAACALLVQRSRTGAGGVHEVVMTQVARQLAEPRWHGLTAAGGMLGGGLPAYGVYAARRGWIAVAALEPAFLQRLAAGLGIPDVTEAALAAAFATRHASDWASWGRAQDVPIAVVATAPPAG